MHFRPCIDIHNGSVKQIVGGSLRDEASQAKENYVSELGADFYAKLYEENALTGGHVIILNPVGSEYYEADVEQAKRALAAYPGGLQLGGGITAENAAQFIDMGASHIIVTSYVFKDGHVNYDNLEKLAAAVGREHIVLDLSCRKRDGQYYIVTDRWQKFTGETVCAGTLDKLAGYCSEYLIHAADVEGKAAGIEEELVVMLGSWGKLPMTYAGGVGSFKDLELLKQLGCDRLDVTIGSALDIFGGSMAFGEVINYCR
jgi:phosphoribosylformimino-5-aminoimidazole carboxamide ribotide isomerase